MNGHRSYTITLDQDPNMQSTDAAIIADNAAYPPSIAITIQKFFKKQMHLKKPVDFAMNFVSNDQEVLAYAMTQLQVLDSDLKRICTTENRGIDMFRPVFLLQILMNRDSSELRFKN